MTIPSSGKLVRDKIPQIIDSSGKRAITVSLESNDVVSALKLKLKEESLELCDADDLEEIEEEIVDVLEVLLAISEFVGLNWSDIELHASDKREERGGFSFGTWLIETQD